MQQSIRIFILSLSLVPLIKLNGQLNIVKIFDVDIPSKLKHTGNDFCILKDDILIPANGGIYSLTYKTWIEKPDTSNILLSFQMSDDQKKSYFSIYHEKINKTIIYCKFSDAPKAKSIANLTPGLFFVKNIDPTIFVYGQDSKAFHIYEISSDSLVSVYESKDFIPQHTFFLNQDIILLAFSNRIISLSRKEGLKELIKIEDFIYNFVVKDYNSMFIITEKGLCLYQDGKLTLLLPEVRGEMLLIKDTLIILSEKTKKLTVFRISS